MSGSSERQSKGPRLGEFQVDARAVVRVDTARITIGAAFVTAGFCALFPDAAARYVLLFPLLTTLWLGGYYFWLRALKTSVYEEGIEQVRFLPWSTIRSVRVENASRGTALVSTEFGRHRLFLRFQEQPSFREVIEAALPPDHVLLSFVTRELSTEIQSP